MHYLTNNSYIFNLCHIIIISLVSGPVLSSKHKGTGISFLHSNSYFLTGVNSLWHANSNYTISGFTDIKYHVQWIRGIFNKHVRKYTLGIIIHFLVFAWF